MRLIVLGATSAIAEATARRYAADGAAILLVARNATRMADIAKDLIARGAERVETAVCDLVEEDEVKAKLDDFSAQLGGIDHLLIAYGILGDQAEAETDLVAAENILKANFNSVVAWSLCAADIFERQGRGTLVVIGSVAGDRGRRANFIYGAAKAGVAALVEGLSHRFANKGPRAVLIKPGPTDTPMTSGFTKRGLLWATPDQIAAIIYIRAKAGGPVAYAPWFWRYIMLIIRNLPAKIFNRLDI